MKRNLCLLLVSLIIITSILIGGCENKATITDIKGTILFTDDSGRTVEIPKVIERVAPCGKVAQMILYAVAPEKMCCLASEPTSNQIPFLDESITKLPVTGQFYGAGKLNKEELIKANPQVIIDFGNKKDNIAKDLQEISDQIGIPVIFIEATSSTYPETFRKLGKLLNKVDQAEQLAIYTENVYKEALDAKNKINDENMISVMYTGGPEGLNCNAKGSLQCEVLETVGVDNAIVVSEVSNKGGGNIISMEELLKADPDVILFEKDSCYAEVKNSSYWQGLKAIKNNKYYEIPNDLYNFLSSPPSINQIIGIRWLGNLVYPELYQYNMVDEVKNFFELFWHAEITDEQVKELLNNSTFKE